MFVFMTILLTPSLSHPFRGFWFCTASLPFGGPLKRRPPVIPSGCLRPPATVSRQPTIGCSRRDLSVEISEFNFPSGQTKAGMNIPILQPRGKTTTHDVRPDRRARVVVLVVK
jgi:hypothetical protein